MTQSSRRSSTLDCLADVALAAGSFSPLAPPHEARKSKHARTSQDALAKSPKKARHLADLYGELIFTISNNLMHGCVSKLGRPASS